MANARCPKLLSHVDIYFSPFGKHPSGTRRDQARLKVSTSHGRQAGGRAPGPSLPHIIQQNLKSSVIRGALKSETEIDLGPKHWFA